MARRTLIAEETLVSMLSEQNPEGMEILYDNYSAAIYGVIHKIIQDDKLAANLLKETFLKIQAHFEQHDSAKRRLFSWMVSIARHLAIEKMRSGTFYSEFNNRDHTRNISLDLGSPDSFSPDPIGLQAVVRQLEPEYKQVIELLFFGGSTQQEAAEKLNVPLGTVKARSRAAIQKLRQQFNTMEKI